VSDKSQQMKVVSASRAQSQSLSHVSLGEILIPGPLVAPAEAQPKTIEVELSDSLPLDHHEVLTGPLLLPIFSWNESLCGISEAHLLFQVNTCV